MRGKTLLLLVIVLSFFSGCTNGRSVDDSSSDLNVGEQSFSGTTNLEGRVSFSFPVSASVTSFQIVLSAPEGQARLVALQDPAGTSILEASSEVGRRGNTESSPYTVSYPYLSGPMSSGSYRAEFAITS